MVEEIGKVVLDACVLYSAPIRDILLNVAEQKLYEPKWSKKIEEEWLRNLLLNRPDLKKSRLERTIEAMNRAFPDALVGNYEDWIEKIDLPDLDDRHVVAVAIESQSKLLVTFNLKDFPSNYLAQFGIKVMEPDAFLCYLFGINELQIREGFENQLKSLRNPSKTREELFVILYKCRLVKFVNLLRNS